MERPMTEHLNAAILDQARGLLGPPMHSIMSMVNDKVDSSLVNQQLISDTQGHILTGRH